MDTSLYSRNATASSGRPQTARPLPLSAYSDTQLREGTTHGLALAPVFVAGMNINRLRREGITLGLHPCPTRILYRSDSGATYTVGDACCNCPAGAHGRRCRHKIAVQRAGGVGLLRNALAYAEAGLGDERRAA